MFVETTYQVINVTMCVSTVWQAMVDATDRAVKLVLGEEPSALLSRVTVYALGDGTRPLSAAAICLHMPPSWKYVSIDPLLEVNSVDLGEYSDRFSLFGGLSQDFDLSHTVMNKTKNHPSLSVVIALHSHAPLSQFWGRLGGEKIAITMECCAEYSELHSAGESPLMEFEDFEVYSPKRTVKIYSSASSSSLQPPLVETEKNDLPSGPNTLSQSNGVNTTERSTTTTTTASKRNISAI